MTWVDARTLLAIVIVSCYALVVIWLLYAWGRKEGRTEGFRKGWVAGIDYERHRAKTQESSDV